MVSLVHLKSKLFRAQLLLYLKNKLLLMILSIIIIITVALFSHFHKMFMIKLESIDIKL